MLIINRYLDYVLRISLDMTVEGIFGLRPIWQIFESAGIQR